MQTHVLIVGAGPVGLLLGNFLGNRGIDTVLVEKEQETARNSRAIGVTPPSLTILKRLGLDCSFIENGIRIENVTVHGKESVLGTVTFKELPSPYRFILSIPQQQTEKILKDNLEQFESVRLITGCELTSMAINKQGISGFAAAGCKELEIRAQMLCACDGYGSTVRKLLHLPVKGKTYPETFLMGDYFDRSPFGSEARLFFTPDGSVESFPLPKNRRRWVIETPWYLERPIRGYLEKTVEQRTGVYLNVADKEWESSFRIHNYIMKRFYRGRVLFLGDAAHTISPIGGQGMNTGFADAEYAACVISSVQEAGRLGPLLQQYQRRRKKAARTAARRAVLSMKVGTIHGGIQSMLRNGLLKLALSACIAKKLANHYSMLSIPYRNLDQEGRAS